MSGIVDLSANTQGSPPSPFNTQTPRLSPARKKRQGLCRLSPDLISKAREETAAQVVRIGLTFVGTATFCLLSLLTPDSALLGGAEKINVPFAGPVSFFGFMLLGPAVLVVLRVFLQIYVEHFDRLDRLVRSVSVERAPVLIPLQNPLIRLFAGLVFYLLLPAAVTAFAWKAAVFPSWGVGLFSLALAVTVSHATLPSIRFSWRSKGLLSVSAAIILAGAMLYSGPLRRPFALTRANLSSQWLEGEALHGAKLQNANLRGANLSSANLSRAVLVDSILVGATLTRADLRGAALEGASLREADLTLVDLRGATMSPQTDLSYAKLDFANLSGTRLIDVTLIGAALFNTDLSKAVMRGAKLRNANLRGAYLNGANLEDADLRDVTNLIQLQLARACGNATTKLPEGLTIKPCSRSR